ncbi:hypothetical protein BH11CYA1_BH11CYA1_06720 [soil metagenome]
MNSKSCYGQGGHWDAPVIPSLRQPHLGSTAKTEEVTSDEDARSISQRLFGQVVMLGSQVCKGPCVGNDKLAFAFAANG